MPTGDVTRLNAITLTGTNFSATEQYSYDPPNLLATKRLSYPGQDPLVLTYKYDGLYRLREQVYPVEYGTPSQAQKRVDYTPGMGGVLKVNGADYASQIAYNPAGQATFITVGPPGAQQTTETYNYESGLLTWQNVRRGSYITPVLTLCYEYYPSHQLWRLQTLLQCNERLGTNYDTLSYDYDALGRLHDVKATDPFGAAAWSETYAYDSYGNRLSVATSGNGPDGSPIPLDGLAGSPTPPNGLVALSYDPKTNHVTTPGFAYDAAGNQIRTQRSDGSWVRYQYDQAGRFAQVTDDSGKSLEQYAYGADGKRSAKTNSGGSTYYLWDGSRVIAEYSRPSAETKWAWSKSHIYLGSRILTTFVPETSGGQFSERAYYHHPDRLGVRLITNSSDNTVTEQATLPFGTLIPGSSEDPINPIFTSYDRSSATGLDYAINRHYHSLERFTQVDPTGMAPGSLSRPQSLNLYSYVTNDPINATDSTGLLPCRNAAECGAGGGSDDWAQSGPLGPDAIVELIGLGLLGNQSPPGVVTDMGEGGGDGDLNPSEPTPSPGSPSDTGVANVQCQSCSLLTDQQSTGSLCQNCSLLTDEQGTPSQLQCPDCPTVVPDVNLIPDDTGLAAWVPNASLGLTPSLTWYWQNTKFTFLQNLPVPGTPPYSNPDPLNELINIMNDMGTKNQRILPLPLPVPFNPTSPFP
jgi:RHS repeat-associated protein